MKYTKEHIELLNVIIADYTEQMGVRFQHFVQEKGGLLDEQELKRQDKLNRAYSQGKITGLAEVIKHLEILKEIAEQQLKAKPSKKKITKKVREL